MREVLFLAQKGVPWQVAWDLTPVRRLAYLVAIGEMDGGEYDWDAARWKDKPP